MSWMGVRLRYAFDEEGSSAWSWRFSPKAAQTEVLNMRRWLRGITFVYAALAMACSELAFARDKASRVSTLGGFITIEVRESSVRSSKVKWRKAGERAIAVEVPQYFVVERIEDVNLDGVIEVWGVQADPDELFLDLYQIDLRSLRSTNLNRFVDAKRSLSAMAGADDAFLAVRFQDMDGDGEAEMIVATPTPTQGTPYQAGKVKWEDVYRLDPWPRLVNERHRLFFEKKREEIRREVSRVEKYAVESENRTKMEQDISAQAVEQLHAIEAREQIKAYREWLRRIEKIHGPISKR